MYTHRALGSQNPNRVLEILETLKNEWEDQLHDVNMTKMQRDDYERKLQGQVGELGNIQQTLYDLERAHAQMKAQYEEEILRLRRLVELAGGNPGKGLVDVAVPPRPIHDPARTTAIHEKRRASWAPNSTAPLIHSKHALGAANGGHPPYHDATDVQPPPAKRARPNADYERATLDKERLPAPSSKDPHPPPRSTVPPPPPPQGPSGGGERHGPPSRGASGQAGAPSGGAGAGAGAPPPPSGASSAASGGSGSNSGAGAAAPPAAASDPAHATPHPMDVDSGASANDWLVVYNPTVQTHVQIDLKSSNELQSVVCCVKFSNDGRSLATGCNRSCQIFDAVTGEQTSNFAEDASREGDVFIRSVCFSPDNKFLATGLEDKTVRIWDIANHVLLHTLRGHELDIYGVDWSRDGRFLVSGSGDRKAKIWNAETTECMFTLGKDEETCPTDQVTSVAISPDGRTVAVGSLDRMVRLWDTATGAFIDRFEGHEDSVYSVAFSPDGKSLASGSLDRTLKLWDLSSARSQRARCRSTFNGHDDFVLSVAFSPDGQWLVSGSKDRTVQFWDPRTAVTHMMLQGHKNSVISVAMSVTGRVFATGGGDRRARIWSYENVQM